MNVERRELHERLKWVIERVEEIFNDPTLDIKFKLRAAEVIATIASKTNVIIRDYEIEEYEQAIERLTEEIQRPAVAEEEGEL